MSALARWTWALFALGGCIPIFQSDDVVLDPATSDATPPVSDALPVDATPTHVTVSGQVSGFPNFQRLEGARITVVDHPEVEPVFSNMIGEFTVPGVPAFSDVTIRFEKDTYMTCVSRVLRIQGANYVMEGARQSLTMVPHDLAVALVNNIGLDLDPEKSAVIATVLQVDRSYLSEATAVLTPVTGEPTIYLGGNWVPDPNEKGTTSTGTAVFLNYAPGEGEVVFSHPVLKNCVGIGTDAPVALRIRMFAGGMTHAGYVECRP
jgi:hypothetical protein